MDEPVLTDQQWEKMAPFGLGKPGDPGRTGRDARLFMEAVLWIVRHDADWLDLPKEYGRSKSVYVRFRNWMRADVFTRMFAAVADDPDMKFAMVDDDIVYRRGRRVTGRLKARRTPIPKVVGPPISWRPVDPKRSKG